MGAPFGGYKAVRRQGLDEGILYTVRGSGGYLSGVPQTPTRDPFWALGQAQSLPPSLLGKLLKGVGLLFSETAFIPKLPPMIGSLTRPGHFLALIGLDARPSAEGPSPWGET